MSLAIDEQALPDVLHGKLVLISNVELVEALGDDLVQIFIKQLLDTAPCLFRLNILVIVVEEEASDPLTLIVSKLLAQGRLEILDREVDESDLGTATSSV